jgi:hypothetical protein
MGRNWLEARNALVSFRLCGVALETMCVRPATLRADDAACDDLFAE